MKIIIKNYLNKYTIFICDEYYHNLKFCSEILNNGKNNGKYLNYTNTVISYHAKIHLNKLAAGC